MRGDSVETSGLLFIYAAVVELADTSDLGSDAVKRTGSSPVSGTTCPNSTIGRCIGFKSRKSVGSNPT